MDRRELLRIAAAALAAAALPGCAAVTGVRVVPSGGAIRLRLDDYPQLAGPGGHLKLMPQGEPTAIHVLRVGDDYVALSPVCQHQGCTVGYEGDRFLCPCHGSMYDRAGAVLRGPTERALRRHPATLSADGELIIRTELLP